MTAETATPSVADMVATAKRLRAARAACRKFLALWLLEQGRNPPQNCGIDQEKELADPMNHDWSLLYLGSILDD